MLYTFKFMVIFAIKYFYTLLTLKNSEIYMKHEMHNILSDDFKQFYKSCENYKFRKEEEKTRKGIEDAVM